ncbi:MAG: hypothetical protein JNJ90_08125 [Saprospiraceae bacterium]|nr:hypothetical protein [Saprospiraceae bacterium]
MKTVFLFFSLVLALPVWGQQVDSLEAMGQVDSLIKVSRDLTAKKTLRKHSKSMPRQKKSPWSVSGGSRRRTGGVVSTGEGCFIWKVILMKQNNGTSMRFLFKNGHWEGKQLHLQQP